MFLRVIRDLLGEPALATVAFTRLFRSVKTWRVHGRARTTRLHRPRACRTSDSTFTSIAFRSTFVTTRTPLPPERNGNHPTPNPKFWKDKYFFRRHLTGARVRCPTGKSN